MEQTVDVSAKRISLKKRLEMESIRRDPIGEFGLTTEKRSDLSDRVCIGGGMKVRNTTAFLASLKSILNKKLPHESEAKAKGRWK